MSIGDATIATVSLLTLGEVCENCPVPEIVLELARKQGIPLLLWLEAAPVCWSLVGDAPTDTYTGWFRPNLQDITVSAQFIAGAPMTVYSGKTWPVGRPLRPWAVPLSGEGAESSFAPGVWWVPESLRMPLTHAVALAKDNGWHRPVAAAPEGWRDGAPAMSAKHQTKVARAVRALRATVDAVWRNAAEIHAAVEGGGMPPLRPKPDVDSLLTAAELLAELRACATNAVAIHAAAVHVLPKGSKPPALLAHANEQQRGGGEIAAAARMAAAVFGDAKGYRFDTLRKDIALAMGKD